MRAQSVCIYIDCPRKQNEVEMMAFRTLHLKGPRLEELKSNRKEVIAANRSRDPYGTQIDNLSVATKCDACGNAPRNEMFVRARINTSSRAHVNKSGSNGGEAPGNHHRSPLRFNAHAQNIDMLVNRLNMTECAYLVVAYITCPPLGTFPEPFPPLLLSPHNG